MPSIHELFKCFEGFTYCVLPSISTWDSGQYFLISSCNAYAQSSYLGENTVTFVFQWDVPVHQEKMTEQFINMTFVIVYQDDILVLSSGSFDDHLRQLDNVFK
jgi:hypothetical protein